MSTDIIVSYDGSPNDDDGLALAKMLAQTGASLALAYVRHSSEFDPRREELAQHDAERRLAQGASWLGLEDIPRHIVISASTGDGLRQLAEEEGATMIVFGSDYRTPPGHAEPGMTAQHLLEGGPIAIAVAAAGLRTSPDGTIETIAVAAPDGDTNAQETADALAGKLGATLLGGDGTPDLVVVGSVGSEGRINLSGLTRSQLNAHLGSVLVLPHGKSALL